MEIGVLAHYRHIIRIETRTMFTLDYLRAERYADFYATKSVFKLRKVINGSWYLSHIFRRIISTIEINIEFTLSR